ncbi:Ldh family oxidoreductase [Aminobacter aganoensis]|uniref:LDH2 family malate/lactate/ureidoglycolate dehydrogenase n=1 Tax=Aminobacter aganoensis TaxID=83264 RepID=A0A7X0KNW1_9HYPH|nr:MULTISPECIES: Ldh family oxidoreductase [Aminobacter]KQU72747.1 hydroxyacid dehydrogenase [Aminobacter sp. DSM 101952]MBB6357585.1 LDH2 family malate/lactate/ureidoglycolate dehydrogenase [Aminobacter aganoensis]
MAVDGGPALLVDASRLETAVAAIFAGLGVPADDAATVAQCLVLADLRGVGTHGISRIPIYADRLRRGLVRARPDIRVTHPMPAAAHVDGDDGLGFVVARRAMQEAIAAASRCGIGVAGVRNSTHFGMAAAYLIEAVDAGYAAFVFTNASPSMPVWGGRTPFLGTSPFAFGAPGGVGSPPIILDMATSVVARGKIRRAMQDGQPIPAGWALDADGRETTDARRAYEGIVLPLGGPKGSGLSLMMEVVAGVMTGAAYGGKVGDQYRDLDRPQNVGHSFIAFRPDLFLGGQAYGDRLDDLVERARACPRSNEKQPILLPGEPEAARAEAALAGGLPLTAAELAMLREQAALVGISLDPDSLGKV